jgi:hypothetical protein
MWLIYHPFPKRKVDFLFRPLSAVSVTNFLFGKTFTKQGSERKTIFTAHITKLLIRRCHGLIKSGPEIRTRLD